MSFPPGFVWGVATANYQIEGGTSAGGRGVGIWDTFATKAGAIERGETAQVACDHLHRYQEDVGLMSGLGVNAYRFSVSWPRLQPSGHGELNPEGVGFYDRLIDTLLDARIQPWMTLYHWDLPQALQDRGGWTNRDIAHWFADFAAAMAQRYADRVSHFIVLNEATMTSHRGHAYGTDAPGMASESAFFASVHHQNLAQGRAIQALRATARSAQIGTSLLLQPCVPVSPSPQDAAAARRMDDMWNRSFLDPLLLGTYPQTLQEKLASVMRPEDATIIRQPVDFVGVNYYVRNFARHDATHVLGVARDRGPVYLTKTSFGSEIFPEGLHDVLIDLRDRYGNPKVYITESGCGAQNEAADVDGYVEDTYRVEYMRAHLAAIHSAVAHGMNIGGHFVWTLLDDFEWGFGYRAKYGLVRVDFASQRRTPKRSFHWYRETIRENGFRIGD